MKKLKSLEKILFILVIAVIICGISTMNQAADTGNIDDIIQSIPNMTSSTPETSQPPVTSSTAESSTPTVSSSSTNIGSVQNQTGNTSLPKTGVDDTAMWILIGGCVLLAIYTYKKVKEYHI